MILTTTPYLDGYKIKKVVGLVSAFTIRTRGFGGQIVGDIESVFGGKITAYEKEMENARIEVLEKIKKEAKEKGANAIIGIDFETSNISPRSPAIVFSSWGTAVVLEKNKLFAKQINKL